MSSGPGEPSEAELIAQTAVSLISLAGRRLGLEPGTVGERDLGQVRDAIDGARALLPVLERGEDGPRLGPLREAISALQLEYAKLAGGGVAPAPAGATPAPGAGADAAPAGPPGGQPSDPDKPGPGPAQSSGRLWIPGS
jgi:hypothetical protein